MSLTDEVHKFISACERLLCEAGARGPLAEDQVRLVEYYCNELLARLVPPKSS
jgi:hypothetical protein